MARLAAMNTAKFWIDDEFAPPGEGLTYVRQKSIQDSWLRHGQPELDPNIVLNRKYASDASTAFVETLIQAGLVSVSNEDFDSSTECRTELSLPTKDGGFIYFSEVSNDLAISIRNGNPVSVTTSERGQVTLKPIIHESDWSIQTTSGCLTLTAQSFDD